MTPLTTRDSSPLSRLTFGAMQFGNTADAMASQALYEAARAAGINHFDTAVIYADGQADALLGPMVAKERESVFVASKVGYTGGAGAANILSQFDLARRQTGLDQIDLLYLHRFDDTTPLEESFSTLARLKSGQLIRHIGVSNFAAWQVMKAQQVCTNLGLRIDVIQPMYNLVKRQAEVEILPMAQDQSLKICAYSPLGGGLLTGKYSRGETGRLSTDDRYASRYRQDWMHQTARDLVALADAHNTDPATLAVAWVAAHPSQPSPIVSARSIAQLTPSLAAETFELTPELYRDLTALSPTPAPATDRTEEA